MSSLVPSKLPGAESSVPAPATETQPARASPLEALTRRALYGLGASARGGLAAWACVLASALLAAPTLQTPATYVLLIGTAAIAPFACMLGFGCLLALRGAAPAAGTATATALPAAAQLRVLALEAATAFACAWLLRGPLEAWVPDEFAYRELIARFVAAHGGVGIAVLAGAGYVWRATGRLASFPLWTAIPLHLVARASTERDVALFWPAHEAALDLATAAFCVFAGTRWAGDPGGRLGARDARRILPAMVAALGCSVVVVVASPGAGAQLVAEFPGPGGAFARVRSLYDLDGDGFAGVLGGLDCDDANLLVGPMALEIAGNGIDDNCMGGDLRVAQAPAAPSRAPGAPRRNVILIVVDTLRADALAHGRTPLPMPNTERFAQRGAVFRRAYSHAPYTGLALRSLVTGEYPMNMSAFEVGLGMGPTLAERLQASGYETSAIVQFDEISRRSGQQTAGSNLFRGFARVDWSLREVNREFRAVTSPAMTDLALAELSRLRAGDRPYLLWLHYFDPHAEYQPHEGTPFDGSTLAGRYWQEVYATDRALGRLYAALEESGFFEDGYVLLTGDHGELLGEGGHHQHALWLDDFALRVPLLVRGPSVPAGRYDTRVRHVDVAPTLLELAAGIHAPLPGRHLAEIWNGAAVADRDVIALTSYDRRVAKRALLSANHKLFIDVLAGGKALYEPSDAGDGANLIERQPQRAAELEARLGRVWDESMNDRVLARRRAGE